MRLYLLGRTTYLSIPSALNVILNFKSVLQMRSGSGCHWTALVVPPPSEATSNKPLLSMTTVSPIGMMRWVTVSSVVVLLGCRLVS